MDARALIAMVYFSPAPSEDYPPAIRSSGEQSSEAIRPNLPGTLNTMAEITRQTFSQPPAFNPRQMLPSIVFDVALPVLSYNFLIHVGFSTLLSLMLGAVFPAAHIAWGFAKTRQMDPLGIIVLSFIAVGTVASLISGSIFFALIKESFLTATFGFICYASLLGERPLMFYISRQFVAGHDPARIEWWNNLWQYPRFRSTMRTITLVWGTGYLLEAVVRVIFALAFSPGTVVAISSPMAIGVTILLIVWATRYGRVARERGMREAGHYPATSLPARRSGRQD